VARRVIEAARKAGRPVVVDPKGREAERYRGATVIKPNVIELGDLSGQTVSTSRDLLDAGQHLAEELAETAVLVTRGAEGMALFRAGMAAITLPAARVQRVFDVTGAGDTVAAALVLAIATGHTVEVAARLANSAAGVAVCKVGTAVVTPEELLAALLEEAADFAVFGG
jgi:rfaE bifunctional protein kinase chain/domain